MFKWIPALMSRLVKLIDFISIVQRLLCVMVAEKQTLPTDTHKHHGKRLTSDLTRRTLNKEIQII